MTRTTDNAHLSFVVSDPDLEQLSSFFDPPALSLDLSGCRRLRGLPAGLSVPRITLRDCEGLRELPAGLNCVDLDLTGCRGLTSLPQDLPERLGRLTLRGCVRLSSLPASVLRVAELDLSGCTDLRELPATLRVTRWVDVADTELNSLPKLTPTAQVRWRGVPIPARAVLRPETLTVGEVLAEPNAEVRRVLIERLTPARFAAESGAVTVDQDRDPGGERALLKLEVPGEDEPMALLDVRCPSTGRRYLLRVPPLMASCHAAAAWIAGFEEPDAYRPLQET